jgi:hypothetical protein
MINITTAKNSGEGATTAAASGKAKREVNYSRRLQPAPLGALEAPVAAEAAQGGGPVEGIVGSASSPSHHHHHQQRGPAPAAAVKLSEQLIFADYDHQQFPKAGGSVPGLMFSAGFPGEDGHAKREASTPAEFQQQRPNTATGNVGAGGNRVGAVGGRGAARRSAPSSALPGIRRSWQFFTLPSSDWDAQLGRCALLMLSSPKQKKKNIIHLFKLI